MDNPNYEFALYTAGHGPNSIRSIGQVKRLLESRLSGAYELRIIDVLKDSRQAHDHGVMAAPTLIRVLPQPTKCIIGDLSDSDSITEMLELPAASEGATADVR